MKNEEITIKKKYLIIGIVVAASLIIGLIFAMFVLPNIKSSDTPEQSEETLTSSFEDAFNDLLKELNSKTLGDTILINDYEFTILDKSNENYLLIANKTFIKESANNSDWRGKVLSCFDENYKEIIQNSEISGNKGLILLTRPQFEQYKNLIPVIDDSWWLDDVSSVTRTDPNGVVHKLRYYVVGSETSEERGTQYIDDTQIKGVKSFSYADNELISIRPAFWISTNSSTIPEAPKKQYVTTSSSNTSTKLVNTWKSIDGKCSIIFTADGTFTIDNDGTKENGKYSIKDGAIKFEKNQSINSYDYEIDGNLLFMKYFYPYTMFVLDGKELNIVNDNTSKFVGDYNRNDSIYSFYADGTLCITNLYSKNNGYFYATNETIYMLDGDLKDYYACYNYEFDGNNIKLYYGDDTANGTILTPTNQSEIDNLNNKYNENKQKDSERSIKKSETEATMATYESQAYNYLATNGSYIHTVYGTSNNYWYSGLYDETYVKFTDTAGNVFYVEYGGTHRIYWNGFGILVSENYELQEIEKPTVEQIEDQIVEEQVENN